MLSSKVTLTLHLAVFPLPSLAVALIVQVPNFLPLTLPFLLTVAIFGFDEVHLRVLLLTFDGVNLTLSFFALSRITVIYLFQN